MEFELGSKLKCKVTGFTGIAVARIVYINGCIQYCVKPKIDKEGKMPEGEYIDVGQLELVRATTRKFKSTPTGGPQRDCPK
jgi:uncharacterized metal-binding protein